MVWHPMSATVLVVSSERDDAPAGWVPTAVSRVDGDISGVQHCIDVEQWPVRACVGGDDIVSDLGPWSIEDDMPPELCLNRL